jgi:hypothetical protein
MTELFFALKQQCKKPSATPSISSPISTTVRPKITQNHLFIIFT